MFPEEWERFSRGSGAADGDVVAAYARLMEDPDPPVRNHAATSWRRWEDVVLSLEPNATPAGWRPSPASSSTAAST